MPPALAAMLAKGRTSYERAIRAVRWGEGPIYAWVSAARISAALALRNAFADLLGWPIEVQQVPSPFGVSWQPPKAGSVVILIAGDLADFSEFSNVLRTHGVQVLTVAGEGFFRGLPGRTEDPCILLPSAENLASNGPAEACLEHAGLLFMTFVAARLLKSPSRLLERWEREWRNLPPKFERMVNQAGDAVCSFAARLRAGSEVTFVGEGLYYAVARRAAGLLERQDQRARALDVAGLVPDSLAGVSPHSVAVFLSGSHGTTKSAVAALAAGIQRRGAAVLAVTDANDRALIRQARLSLLVPTASQTTASVLGLGLAGWAVCERGPKPNSRAGRQAGR